MAKINIDFNNLIGELTEEEYKNYIASWFDDQIVVDIMNDWDEDVKGDAIKEIKEIIAKRDLKDNSKDNNESPYGQD